jgi:hypothetical protein
MVVDHHVHLVLHDHVLSDPNPHIHLQFVVDLDNPFHNTVVHKDHIVVVVVDNHHHHQHHHHHHHVLTIRLLDDLNNI